ncbi:STAS/SEC14 domain-containing protein [Histidinibacterium lentulum]|nr:STAS/SEC14 domain-containing protein [Histidinibacterium lentulum]
MDSAHIQPFDTGLPATCGFRIAGKVTRTDMSAMAERVLEAFDRHDKIDMLLVFDRYDGSETGASLSTDAIKAQTASLWNVRAYVTAGAPEGAGEMVETMGRLIPVDAKSFPTEREAMAYLASLHPLS